MGFSIQPLALEMPDGSIKKYRYAWAYPAFLYLPQEFLLYVGDKKIQSINRNPRALIKDPDQLKILDDDHFFNFCDRSFAYLVWRNLTKDKSLLLCYSRDNPIFVIAHWLPIYLEQLHMDIGLPTFYEIMEDPEYYAEDWGFFSYNEVKDQMSYIVPRAIERMGLQGTIDTVKEFVCFEDFNTGFSTYKMDFFRKWYHTRTKHPQMSLDEYTEGNMDQYNGYGVENDVANEEIPFEDFVISKVDTELFMSKLSDRDQQIIKSRLEGKTYEKIAAEVGFKTHSAVLKRIKKIGEEYQKFSGDDLGF